MIANSRETIASNARGSKRLRVRRETLNGRAHLVAPVTMIVPGVLNGSRGPLFYPVYEIGRDPAAWNQGACSRDDGCGVLV